MGDTTLLSRWAAPANALCAITYVCRQDYGRPLPSKMVERLPALLDRVLNGAMTPTEAHAAYGGPPPGKGRPRRFNTFADYLAERIRYAEDPAVEQDLREILARSVGPHRYGSRQARSAETVRIGRLLAETGRERADRLRELKAELDDTGGSAWVR